MNEPMNPNERLEELAEVMFCGLRQTFRRLRYRHHPDQNALYEYLTSPGGPLFAELADPTGQRGWTRSSISLHVLSCPRCTREIARLRRQLEVIPAGTPWWQSLVLRARLKLELATLRLPRWASYGAAIALVLGLSLPLLLPIFLELSSPVGPGPNGPNPPPSTLPIPGRGGGG